MTLAGSLLVAFILLTWIFTAMESDKRRDPPLSGRASLSAKRRRHSTWHHDTTCGRK